MKHKWFYPAIILVIVAASLLIVFRVDREKAIRQAILACQEIYGLQLQETPIATQTTLTTYGRTISPGQNRELWWPTDAGRLVWFIRIKGNWMTDGILRGPPPADGDSTRAPALVQTECTIVVSAFTGEVKTEPIE